MLIKLLCLLVCSIYVSADLILNPLLGKRHYYWLLFGFKKHSTTNISVALDLNKTKLEQYTSEVISEVIFP